MQNKVSIFGMCKMKAKFTKYCTCAAENPGEEEQLSREDRVLYHIGVGTLYAKKHIYRKTESATFPTK